ncbi:MAG: SAM-dependent chlorinase/fluorinase [Bacteroidia bacterium]|nr:SAM-dependent chlorinase/fluorinase [Bacteroidia bacterium]
MSIITLTTDLGLKDHYVSAVKGKILSELPEATIVDISHQITPFNIIQAAYVLRNAWHHFPAGTVHIMGVNMETVDDLRDIQRPYIGVSCEGHYFIGYDSGVFGFIFDKVPDLVVELSIKEETPLKTFPLRDVFVKGACHLARGGTLEVIGKRKDSMHTLPIGMPAVTDNSLRGMVIFIDSFSNVVYNITEKQFREVGKGRDFTIYFRSHRIQKISSNYRDVLAGEILALFNSSGHLEIAQNQGPIGKLQSVHLTDPLMIEFT